MRFLLSCTLSMFIGAGVEWGQQLAPDAAGCTESTILPRMHGCRIDNCERKDSYRKDVPVRADQSGEPVDLAMEGPYRATMYECLPPVTPALVSNYFVSRLTAAGYHVPYNSTLSDVLISAQKGPRWVLLEAIAKYYTLTEIAVSPPDPGDITDAAGMAEEITRAGRVAVYGIDFGPRQTIQKESEPILQEVIALFKDHPDWNLSVEGHTSNSLGKQAAMEQSGQEAEAVVTWLGTHGLGHLRITASGRGDAEPVADNATPEGRAKNQRIEIVRQ